MVYKLLIAEQAEKQIEKAIAYVTEVLKNPKAAADILDDILHVYNTLELAKNVHLPSLVNAHIYSITITASHRAIQPLTSKRDACSADFLTLVYSKSVHPFSLHS